jgi:hypothetical protein
LWSSSTCCCEICGKQVCWSLKNQKRLSFLKRAAFFYAGVRFSVDVRTNAVHPAESHGIKITTFSGKKALDKCGVLTYNKNRKSTPVDGLLPLL